MAQKILIVDDDPQIRTLLSKLLAGDKYEIADAASGSEAVQKIKAEDFSILLLDVMMPEMDGMEVLATVKKLKPRIKVIIITAFATVENAVECMKKGASDYISKPFRSEEVRSTIKRVLEEAKFDEKLAEVREYTPRINSIIASLSSPIRREAVEYLLLEGSASFTEIIEKLGVSDHTKLSFHLRKLKSSGVVEQDSEKRYLLTEEGRKIAQSLRNLKEEVL